MNKNLLEEISKFRLLSFYDPKKVLSEQNISEAVQFGPVDRYLLMSFNKRGMPRLIDLGTKDKETKIFKFTENGQKYFGITGNGGIPKKEVKFDELEKNQKFITGRSITLKDTSTTNRIVADFELDAFLNNLIEEQETFSDEFEKRLYIASGTDWKKGTSGTILLDLMNSETFVNAYNIMFSENDKPNDLMYLLEGKTKPAPQILKMEEVKKEGDKPNITLDDTKIGGTFKTYCANMIKPNFSDENVKKEFEEIIKRLKTYISAPPDENGVTALSKLTNITIFGQADSGMPGWVPGEPCYSKGEKIDHDYGGIEKLPVKIRANTNDPKMVELNKKMNLYLAVNRAKVYKQLIIDRIKKDLNVNISIKELPAKEYYGQGESKRGPDFRSINLTFNAPIHTYVSTSNQTTSDGDIYDPTKKETTEIDIFSTYKKEGFVPGILNMNTPQGVKKFTVLEKNEGESLYVSENNIHVTDQDKGQLNMIHKISFGVQASLSGKDLKIKTSSGELTMPGIKGPYGGDAYTSISLHKGLGDHWLEGCSSQFLQQVGVSFGGPGNEDKDFFPTYDDQKIVKINNEVFYELNCFSYLLVPMRCSSDRPAKYSKNQVLMNIIGGEPRFTKTQIKYLAKEMEKYIKIDMDKINNLLEPTKDNEGESIQMDINYEKD